MVADADHFCPDSSESCSCLNSGVCAGSVYLCNILTGQFICDCNLTVWKRQVNAQVVFNEMRKNGFSPY